MEPGTSRGGGGYRSGLGHQQGGGSRSSLGQVVPTSMTPPPPQQPPPPPPPSTSTAKSLPMFVWTPSDVDFEDDEGGLGSMHVPVTFGVLAGTFLALLIAFTTPNWLAENGTVERPKMKRIGLWEGCFNSLEDDNRLYDIKISGCWFLLSEELYHLDTLIFKPFFVAVQFFFTVSFILMIAACILVPMYLVCFGPDHPYYTLLIKVVGLVLISSGFLGSIAIILFGIYGNGRYWMPDWQNNYLSWSWAFGVVGVIGEFVSGTLFLVEGRIQVRKKKLRESHSAYTMESKA